MGAAWLGANQFKQLVEFGQFPFGDWLLLEFVGRDSFKSFEGLVGADVLDGAVESLLKF